MSRLTSGRKRPLPRVISLGEVRSNRAYQQLLTQLEAFCETLPDDEPWSLDQFFGGEPTDQEMEVLQYAYLDWLIFDYRAWEDGRTVLERFAEKTQLDDTSAAMLQAWRSSRMGLYHVAGAFGDSALLRDCLTGAEYTVLADEGIEPFSDDGLVICRILPVGNAFHLSYDVRTTAAELLPEVKQALERELLRMQRQSPDATWAHLFKHRWPVVHDAITGALAAGAAQPLPQWRTPPSPGHKPAETNDLQEEVATVVWEFLTQDDVSFTDRMRAMALWWDAATILTPRTGKVEAWAAGAVYAHLHYALADGTSQAEIAEMFGISTSALATRARAIADALALEELDDRYADPLDPRVRFRSLPEPLSLQAVAPALLPDETSTPVDEAAVQRLLSLPAEDAVVLTLLGQSALAGGDKKTARSYAEQARDAYLKRQGEPGARREGLLRLVELLAELGDDEAILAVTHGAPLRELEGPVLRRLAVAASRGGKPGLALSLMELAREKGEPFNLVEPFIGALQLMEQKRIPVYKLDYQERVDSMLGWVPKLNALTRSHLVIAIFAAKAKDAVQAVRVVGAQRDPWAGRLLKHLHRQTDLPRTVQSAIDKALTRWL